jgi:CTP:molybdopterin cytidylyltransferase MocA
LKVKTHSIRNATAALATAALVAATVGVVSYAPASSDAAEASTTHSVHRTNNADKRSRQAITFRNKMRKLWEDHIVWTRQFIVSSVADLPDANTAAGRLLANQDHIGDAIKPYYGEEAGEALSALLRDHILIAADILTAAKNGDSAGVEEANARWHGNADEIADFLAAANPKNWPQEEMREMMSDHLDWTLAEAVARLNADWNADVAAYDRIHRDILQMADMLSIGIINRFPGRF